MLEGSLKKFYDILHKVCHELTTPMGGMSVSVSSDVSSHTSPAFLSLPMNVTFCVASRYTPVFSVIFLPFSIYSEGPMWTATGEQCQKQVVDSTVSRLTVS